MFWKGFEAAGFFGAQKSQLRVAWSGMVDCTLTVTILAFLEIENVKQKRFQPVA